jgi:S1-C subfamily serine protease
MFEFIRSIIKGAIAVIAGGVIAVSGLFIHKPVQSIEAPKPEIENQVQASSTQGVTAEKATTTQQNILKPPAAQENKPATTTIKIAAPVIQKPTVPKPELANPPVATEPPVSVQGSGLVQEVISLPPVIKIDPETFVGILCYFDTSVINPADGRAVLSGSVLVRGSGVIINSKGYVLTNRHVVVQQDSIGSVGDMTNVLVKYKFDHCDVGQLPQGTHLPTVDEIKAINPLVRIPVLAYTAQPVFDSSSLPLSDLEYEYADFAILKITGLSADGPTFGFTSVPVSFPYAKLLPIDKYKVEGEGIVTYGFPGDVTTGQRDAFQTLTMTGSVGSVTRVEVGDKYYADTPMVIRTNLEISHGRSGSPLFWRGYVIGLTTFFISDNRTDSGSVASDAIIKGLQSTGYIEN